MIGLIMDGVVTWTSDVEYYSKICLELEEKCDDKFYKLFQAYSNLLEAFDIFKKIFKFRILFRTFDTFFHGLLYVQVTLEVLNTDVMHFNKEEIRVFVIITVLLTGKNVVSVAAFSLYCEKLYLSLIEADAVCSRLQKSQQSNVEAKKLYKNVRRLNRAAFHKMTACRIFTIDGRLPFRFNSLVLEYIFVILQFAFVT
ncbi:hypothetical protein PYW08_001468 [Mythimna loreyi]|uniref:Uncharacterized protein n=1 Tax=Mythimna loreyi TaxID=667449 RepID=A0ACC2R6S9_9NEOP|nr:hypothetical protein PYW08_001468 [Mythimna loreyi]